MAEPALPDDLLEEIFLRLPTANDLARASMACVSFRRVITGHPFLRRFRILHPPPLLGFLCGNLIPAQPPHPSAAAAATFANTDFSGSFLPPSVDRWCLREVRDGRALFSPALEGCSDDYNPRDLVREFAVCDPLHRRYLVLPAIPDDLANQVHQPDIVECEPFLAPPGDGEEDSSFRVMCLVRYRAGLSSSSSLPAPDNGSLILLHLICLEDGRHSATTPMDASAGRFLGPTSCWCLTRAGWSSLLSTSHLHLAVQCDIWQLWRQEKGGQWQSKSVISLPANYRYGIMGVAGGYLLLYGYPKDDREVIDYFSLNLQTFKIEWFFQTGDYIMLGDLYADFPPPLSPPTI
ncbi:hypothetical protein ACQ4PT_061050 [Festuca glaucescens]